MYVPGKHKIVVTLNDFNIVLNRSVIFPDNTVYLYVHERQASPRIAFLSQLIVRVRQEEGKVNIEYIPEKDKEKAQSECNSGEYVDFEEID